MGCPFRSSTTSSLTITPSSNHTRLRPPYRSSSLENSISRKGPWQNSLIAVARITSASKPHIRWWVIPVVYLPRTRHPNLAPQNTLLFANHVTFTTRITPPPTHPVLLFTIRTTLAPLHKVTMDTRDTPSLRHSLATTHPSHHPVTSLKPDSSITKVNLGLIRGFQNFWQIQNSCNPAIQRIRDPLKQKCHGFHFRPSVGKAQVLCREQSEVVACEFMN